MMPPKQPTPITQKKQKRVLSADYLEKICALPADFHGAGVMASDVLRMMARLLSEIDLTHSAETGCGKTTLLFSQLSDSHCVFAKDVFDPSDGESEVNASLDTVGFDTGSIQAVEGSSLLNLDSVRFIVGSTQHTLPRFKFEHSLDAVLIDGPHGYPFPELEYYYFYPQIRPGGLLFLDDIHIPTIWRMFEFLLEDEMFELLEVCAFTAAFRRTDKPCFDPMGDGWWLQEYNRNRQVQAAALCRARLEEVLKRSNSEHDPLMTKAASSFRPAAMLFRGMRLLLGKKLAWRLRNAWQAFKVKPQH